MIIALMVVSGILILLVLLQSSKAEAASQIFTGNNTDLFKNRKERGSELIMSRATMLVGLVFFVLCLIISFM